MTVSDVERSTAQVLDLLSPTQIMALTNASGRGSVADTYQTVLSHDLRYGLPKRDPDKVRLLIREMSLSQSPDLTLIARDLQEQLSHPSP